MLELIYAKKFNTKKMYIADDTPLELQEKFLANELKYTGSLAFFVPCEVTYYDNYNFNKIKTSNGITFYAKAL